MVGPRLVRFVRLLRGPDAVFPESIDRMVGVQLGSLSTGASYARHLG
jgi:hypothetical protein